MTLEVVLHNSIEKGCSTPMLRPIRSKTLGRCVHCVNNAKCNVRALRVERERTRGTLSAIGSVGEEALFPDGPFESDYGFVLFGGLRYDIGLGKTEADVREAQARLALQEIDVTIENTERILRETTRRLQTIAEHQQQQIKSSVETVNLRKAHLDEEQRNYRIGRSVLKNVVDARTALTRATYAQNSIKVSLLMTASELALLDGRLTETWRQQLGQRSTLYPQPARGV